LIRVMAQLPQPGPACRRGGPRAPVRPHTLYVSLITRKMSMRRTFGVARRFGWRVCASAARTAAQHAGAPQFADCAGAGCGVQYSCWILLFLGLNLIIILALPVCSPCLFFYQKKIISFLNS
jgi:hypothetical protein